jgi:SAM-dependent methyltransferase
MKMEWDAATIAQRMRQDWDRRAIEDAAGYVYTRDKETDVFGFDESGLANYNQLIRPYLPILLNGAPAGECRVLEIGCGAGRMTRWMATHFGSVTALDVSAEMLSRAETALDSFPNVEFVQGTGFDLAGCASGVFDLVFSYIVFQHIPSASVISNYVREAARVLKPGGCFKFQLNGDRSPEYLDHERDTWLGETFSSGQVRAMLDASDLAWIASEGEGTQYFTVTARKGARAVSIESHCPAGEPRSAAQIVEGAGEAVNGSWRPMESRMRLRLRVPEGAGRRCYFAAYVWPGETALPCSVAVALGGQTLGAATIRCTGDAYMEFNVPDDLSAGEEMETVVALNPAPLEPPAFRAMGLYTPRGAPDYDRGL